MTFAVVEWPTCMASSLSNISGFGSHASDGAFAQHVVPSKQQNQLPIRAGRSVSFLWARS